MNDLKTTNETFDTNEIKNNVKAIKELQQAVLSCQEALNNTSNTETPWIDNIKKIILVMDALQTITSKLQNVGRGKMFPFIHCYCFENADINMCSSGY